jgi:hypothetical protein
VTRLQALLAQWQIALPVSNRFEVVNYARTSSAREGAMDYFKLKLGKGESQTILADQLLAKRIEFSQKAEFYNDQSRSWWRAPPGATCFWGTIDPNDKGSMITLFIVMESENDWLFIKALSGQ